MIQLDNGGMYETVHNFLDTQQGNGSISSEVFIRCPLGFISDCRTLFAPSPNANLSQPTIIGGLAYFMCNSSTYCPINTNNSAAASSFDLNTTAINPYTQYTNNTAWIAADNSTYNYALPAIQPIQTSVFATYYQDAQKYGIPYDSYGTQYFTPGNLTLTVGQGVIIHTSPTLGYLLALTNTDLILYQCTNYNCTNGFQIWATGKEGSSAIPTEAVFQADGNLVLYSGSTALWATGTEAGGNIGSSGALIFAIQLDGNLVIYDQDTLPNPELTNAIMDQWHINSWQYSNKWLAGSNWVLILTAYDLLSQEKNSQNKNFIWLKL